MGGSPNDGRSRYLLRGPAGLAIIGVFLASVLAASVALVAVVARSVPSAVLQRWADVGQAFGAFSAVVAAAALVALLLTFLAQQHEARQHRIELEGQRRAAANSERELHCCAEVGLSM